jgi:outer membrane receptor protein involved in Fe transport
VDAVLNTVDVMPALALTWSFDEWLSLPIQLRAAGSKTVSRPEMRELSPAVFVDVTGGRSRFGNPDVKPAGIWHGDLRAEWYPFDGDMLAVGVFGKIFSDPIETVITAGADQSITVQNAPSARLIGVEAEVKKGFGFIHAVLAPLSVGINGALISSHVDLPAKGIHTSKERALEGQSPWIGNLQVAWDDDDLGTHAALLYNATGPRIVEVGVLGAPDVYEQGQHQLDLMLGQRVWGGLTIAVRGSNLLDIPQLRTQGSRVTERVWRGRAASVTLSFAL